MKYISFILIFSILIGCKTEAPSYASTDSFQLAPPSIKADSVLFKSATTLSMRFSFPDSNIKYTLDGSEVDESSMQYTAPIKLKKAATINAKAFHVDFKPSEQVSVQVNKIIHNISDANVTIVPEPHENYKGKGSDGLVDMQKGNLQFRSGNQWMGFQSPKVTIALTLKNKLPLSQLKVSSLQNQSGWIFAPKEIKVYAGETEVGLVKNDTAGENQENKLSVLTVPLKKGNYTQLSIEIFSLEKIPQWHQGKGTTPWLFLDEILVE